MKEIISKDDHDSLDQRVAEAEKQTNTQIVLATVKRSDEYPELPWKAFALGAAIAGLVVFIVNFFLVTWPSTLMSLISVAIILGMGIICAVLTVFFNPFAKLFLTEDRVETEVRQYAESFFLSRELFATNERTGILILISLFEKHVIILPDIGIRNELTNNILQEIIRQMSRDLRKRKIVYAFETALETLSKILEESASHRSSGKDELSNEIIEEKGV